MEGRPMVDGLMVTEHQTRSAGSAPRSSPFRAAEHAYMKSHWSAEDCAWYLAAETGAISSIRSPGQTTAEQVHLLIGRCLAAAAAKVQAASVGVMVAQESYQLAALRYSAGKSITAERLDALSAQTRAQGTLAQAKAQLVIAHTMLQATLAEGNR